MFATKHNTKFSKAYDFGKSYDVQLRQIEHLFFRISLPVTFTTKEQVETEFPESSVAVYVTVVSPIWNKSPEL